MSTDINILIAFFGGLLSFFSPCIIPLVPSYLSYIGGVGLEELREPAALKNRVLLRTLCFVFGFSAVFMLLGAMFSGTALLFSDAATSINLVAGAVVVLLGVHMIVPFTRLLQLERRIPLPGRPRGYMGSIVVGMAFGAGWTPCIGPILAAILFLAGSSAAPAQGVLYLAAYSVGLGAPFIVTALFFDPIMRRLRSLGPRYNTIKRAAGAFLIAIGLSIAFGRFQYLNIALARTATALERLHAAHPGASRLGFAVAALALALLPVVIRRVRAPRNSSDTGSRRVTPVALRIWVAIWIVIATLQSLGVIEIAALLQSYLRFQGV